MIGLCRSPAGVELFSTAAGGIFILHRRTFDRTVRTEDTAITRLGAQQRLAVGAFVEKLACVCRHWLALREAANRAHQHGFKKNFAHSRFNCGQRKDNQRPQSP
jgi:hypothetical protein